MKSISLLHILTLVFTLTLKGQQSSGSWKYLGPKENPEQVKGFFKSLWADENDLNVVLAGSCSGGLFMSNNALSQKPSWVNITDTYKGMSHGISDIVVRPNSKNKIIYVATGNVSGVTLGYGNGVLKTTNGGISWQEVGPKALVENLFCLEGMTINKDNPDEMIAYTAHDVYLTKDDWKNYEKVELPIDKNNKNVLICDVDFAPFERGKFYICTRTNNHYDSKLFVCEDYGIKINDISPKDIKSERVEVTTIYNEKFKGRFYIALGYVNVYVRYFNGKYFSPDLNTVTINQTFGGAYWNLELCINQKDTNIIYLSMTETSRSTDGGKTFEKISFYNGHNTHADVRAMILPNNSAGGQTDALFVGNDGGISFINNYKPVNWQNLNGTGLDANQFWGISVAQSDTLLVAGGTQDAGGFLITDRNNLNTMGTCGDGYLALAVDENSAIEQCNFPSMFYHNIKTNQNIYMPINDPLGNPRRPIQMKDSFIYVAHHNIWRINKYRLASGNATFNQYTNIEDYKATQGGLKNNTIKCMSIGLLNSAIICYGNPAWGEIENTGKIFFCKNFHEPILKWLDITPITKLGALDICLWSEISSIEIDPVDPFKFCFVSSDIFDQTNVRLVQMTYFADSNQCILKQINSNLPKTGINDIKTDKFSNITYLACDDGVYYTNLNSDTIIWRKLNSENGKLPSVIVREISFNYVTNSLVAGTFGRGVWQTQLVSILKNKKIISTNSAEDEAIKIDGLLIVKKKKTYTVNAKLIITKGSKIELMSGSTLIIKDKNLVRDENNKLIDLDLVVKKNKNALILFK